MSRNKLADVFKTVGLPRFNYVKPSYFGEVRADIEQAGKHVLVEGPSGIGKTCVVYKVFEELNWSSGKEYTYLSCRDSNAPAAITAYLDAAFTDKPNNQVLVADDFHILEEEFRNAAGVRLKQVSDRVFELENSPKLILIGIPASAVLSSQMQRTLARG